MKKFFICLLIICTICLGCFALTACDDDNNSCNEPKVKCEYVKNEFKEFDREYLGVNYHYEWNLYTFRIWYSYSYFLDGARWSPIICTSPNIITYWGPGFDEDITYDGEILIDSRYFDFYAEYLFYGYEDHSKCIKPDSWIYFAVKMCPTKELNNPRSITIQLGTSCLAKYTIDISNTYKTA